MRLELDQIQQEYENQVDYDCFPRVWFVWGLTYGFAGAFVDDNAEDLAHELCDKIRGERQWTDVDSYEVAYINYNTWAVKHWSGDQWYTPPDKDGKIPLFNSASEAVKAVAALGTGTPARRKERANAEA